MRLDGDQKLPLFAVEEWELCQIALEGQFRLAGRAAFQGITDPVTGIHVDCRRQVAPDRARVGTRQCGRQVNAAWFLTIPLVDAVRRTGGVWSGKFGAQ